MKNDFLEDRKATASPGVTHFRKDDTVNSLIKRADELLYKAKKMVEIVLRKCINKYFRFTIIKFSLFQRNKILKNGK